MSKTEELKKILTCVLCGNLQQTFSEVTYSQGRKVCLDCKDLTKESDKRAFDRDMTRP